MPLRLWRIVTGAHPAWSAEGARRFGQRWNPPGMAAIYTGTSFAICLLEVLVHANRLVPPSGARYVDASVPDDVSRETFDTAAHPGWDDPFDRSVAQGYGRSWIAERRSALLFVPSVVTAGRDMNPDHADAAGIAAGPEQPAIFDPRLFPR